MGSLLSLSQGSNQEVGQAAFLSRSWSPLPSSHGCCRIQFPVAISPGPSFLAGRQPRLLSAVRGHSHSLPCGPFYLQNQLQRVSFILNPFHTFSLFLQEKLIWLGQPHLHKVNWTTQHNTNDVQLYSESLPHSKALVTGVILEFCLPQGSEVWGLCPLCGDGNDAGHHSSVLCFTHCGLISIHEVPHSSCIWPNIADEKPVV